MKINLPGDVRYILENLYKNGFDGYVVGGCVRDSLLGRDAADWDITTNAVPEEIIGIFKDKSVISYGMKHGTIPVIIHGSIYEITTFRVESKYSDFRRPDSIAFSYSLEEDLKRRDFTINSMAYNDKYGLIDIFGGSDDLNNSLIKCVGDPDERFREDALRMIRAVRFSAQLGFTIEDRTIRAIMNNSCIIKNISSERIREEFIKIVLSNHPGEIARLINFRLLDFIIPNLSALSSEKISMICKEIIHKSYIIEKMPYDPALRLALLLHDVESHCPGFTGYDRFSHSMNCAGIAKGIFRNLKFDGSIIHRIINLINNHDIELYDDKKNTRIWLSKLGEEDFLNLVKLKHYMYMDNDSIHTTADNILDKVELNIHEIIQNNECFSRKQLAINGEDLKKLGYSQGEQIGEILDELMDLVIDNPSMNNKESLIMYLK